MDTKEELPPNKMDLLIDLILENTTLFHDQYAEPFAVIRSECHREIWPVHCKSFRRWISNLFWSTYAAVPSGGLLSDALRVVEGAACFNSPKHQLHNRITWHDGAIYYDLSDDDSRAVRIDEGGWKVVDPPILFRRYAHQKAQVEPVETDVDAYKDLLSKYFNLKNDDDMVLLLVTVPTYFIPDMPRPVWVPFGPPGSTKSTMLRIMKELVDPSNVGELSFPSNHHELVQQMAHHYFLNYDNIGVLRDWASDAICRGVTGTGFSKRRLFTSDDDVIYSFTRCIALNGINIVPRNGDLLERSILIELKKPAKYIHESKLWKQFQKDKPKILGALLTIVSRALDSKHVEPIANIRMVDYCRWGETIARVLSYGKNAFTNAYVKNDEMRNVEALEAHLLGPAILALMRRSDEWQGTPSELLTKLEETAGNERINTRIARWPKSPSALSRQLNELKANIESVGIKFQVSKSGVRKVRIWKMPPNVSTPSK